MGNVIGVSGKGGVGKTLISALLVKYLAEKNGRNVLAIDADPDSNLPDVMGESVPKTIADLKDFLLEERSTLPPDYDTGRFLETQVLSIIAELGNFDLLVMGRGEGASCYCYVNSLLRDIVSRLMKSYDDIVIDLEAGLEHLSRGTIRDVNILVVVTDPTFKGFQTAKRIKDLAQELSMDFERVVAVANRVSQGSEEEIKEMAERFGVELMGIIHRDSIVEEFDLKGTPILDLPPTSSVYNEVNKVAESLEL
jgi:CO dehydrogenase maturation factor